MAITPPRHIAFLPFFIEGDFFSCVFQEAILYLKSATRERVMEEFYRVASEVQALAAEESDPDKQKELRQVADEYAELIKLLQE